MRNKSHQFWAWTQESGKGRQTSAVLGTFRQNNLAPVSRVHTLANLQEDGITPHHGSLAPGYGPDLPGIPRLDTRKPGKAEPPPL